VLTEAQHDTTYYDQFWATVNTYLYNQRLLQVPVPWSIHLQALELLCIVIGWQEVYEYTLYTPRRFVNCFCLVVKFNYHRYLCLHWYVHMRN